jgi:Uri superfamily endonuclease
MAPKPTQERATMTQQTTPVSSGPSSGCGLASDLRKAEFITQFGCSNKTAERDLRDLRRRGLIEFVGPAKGHWRLVQQAVDAIAEAR